MSTAEEQLDLLERELRQLQIEYDRYFMGGRPRPPGEVEWRVRNVLKQLAENTKLKYAQRFRYNNMAARYAKFSEVWRQRVKKMEAGLSPYNYSKTARELQQKRLAEEERRHQARMQGGVFSVELSDAAKNTEEVQSLYRNLVKAKHELGETADVDFNRFYKFVRKKTEQLKKQMKCPQVEYTVSVENGQVKLKARGT